VGQRGLAAHLTTEGNLHDAHVTHSLGISPDVSDRLYATLGLRQSSGADNAARVVAWATALQHPWLVDILNIVQTFPAEHPTFRLLLDKISDMLLQRRCAPALALPPPAAHAPAPPTAPGTTKFSLYTNDRPTYKQLPTASVAMLAGDRDFQSGVLAASRHQDFPAAAHDLHPKQTISQSNHVVNKVVHTLTVDSAEKNKDILKTNPELQAVQEGILGLGDHAVQISLIASVLSRTPLHFKEFL
jgi:hypothetical protein